VIGPVIAALFLAKWRIYCDTYRELSMNRRLQPMKARTVLVILALTLGFFSPYAVAEDEAEEAKDYRYGTIRLAAFWVGQIDNTMVARSASFPVGIFIDLSRDFALGDSFTVPRGMFGYRFSRRHQVNVGYFQVSRDNQVVLERTIEIGESEFPIGAQVNFSSDTRVYKAAYTWLFYDSDKVVLGASFGLNIVDFGARLTGSIGAEPIGETEIGETTGKTAPLPVVGLRLVFRPTRRLSLIAAADILVFEYGKYGGTYQDNYAMLDWRLSKIFSIGGGVNSLDLELEFEEDIVASVRHRYRGVIGFVGFHF
jgi:hypothetical protein